MGTGSDLNNDFVSDVIAHHGIKGQKWGVRRKRGPDGTVGGNPSYKKTREERREARDQKRVDRLQRARTKAEQKVYKQETKEIARSAKEREQAAKTAPKNSTQLKNRKVSDLSNAELAQVVERLAMEKRLSELTTTKDSKSFTKNLISNVGQSQVTKVTNIAADLAVEQLLTQVGSRSGNTSVTEAADRLKKKNKGKK